MYTRDELTPDGLHPNDKGHRLVAEKVTSFLDEVKSHMEEQEEENSLPAPFTANAYENARRLTIREISPKLLGFRADAKKKTGHLDHFKNGWIGRKPGEKIIFEIAASCIAVQYRKTIRKPALGQSWFWTERKKRRFCLREILRKTGAIACICSLYCTMGK